MRNWLLRLFFGKTIRELEESHENFLEMVELAKKEKEFLLRNNVTCLEPEDMKSTHFKTEISSIWNSNAFQYLLHMTRNKFIMEMVRGNDTATKNVAGMLKGIEALAVKMQEIELSSKGSNDEKV